MNQSMESGIYCTVDKGQNTLHVVYIYIYMVFLLLQIGEQMSIYEYA